MVTKAATKARTASSSSTQAKGRPRAKADKPEQLPLGKALASTDKAVRDGAIRSLAAYLSQADVEPLSNVEMTKLWKGIFYCFWMSDKPRVQAALAQEMADIVLSIDQHQAESSSASSSTVDPAWQYFEAFLDTMVREWWGLDKWRIDKFMMLVRRFFQAAFRLSAQQGWRSTSVERFTAMLIKPGGILDANNVKTPHGLMYHVCDLYMEEWEKSVQVEEDDEAASGAAVPVLPLLSPFFHLLSTCHSSHHFDRALTAVVQPFLDDCQQAEEEQRGRNRDGPSKKRQKRVAEEDGGAESSACQYANLLLKSQQSPAQLRRATFAALFAMASGKDAVEARRRKIYKMCRDEEDRLEEEEDAW